MKLSNMHFYGGAREKVCRLGLAHLFLEGQEILMSTEGHILDRKHGNGAGVVRQRIDERCKQYDEWQHSPSGDVDWIKRVRFNESVLARLGVEMQVSGRSDLLARDIVHIRNQLQDSHIDVGVIVVPSDAFAYRLTDRVATFAYAVRYVEEELREAQTYPIVLLGVEQDGFASQALPKKKTNQGGAAKTSPKGDHG